MPEHEGLVGSYVHLAREPRASDALHALKKIASQVKPIMRARGWKVGQLAEFYPNETNLLGTLLDYHAVHQPFTWVPRYLGLNVNRGAKILLRLRYPGDKSQFLPFENVLDTMLHELAHIVHGPHNQQFHALWDQLRDECQGLMMKGYTGEGFLGKGRRLGGASMPDREARRLAREAAEKRRIRASQAIGSGQRLGGHGPRPGQDIRQVIASAAEKRNAVLKGCGSGRYNDGEIVEIADAATRNGFQTQAEEDEANEIAIAQALWELVQEEEKAKHGQSYVRPSPDRPEGPRARGPLTRGATGERDQASRAVAAAQASTAREPKDRDQGNTDYGNRRDPGFWVCELCTLHNPPQYLCCEACGSQRSQQVKMTNSVEPILSEPRKKETSMMSDSTTIDLTGHGAPKTKRHQENTAVRTRTHDAAASPSTTPEAPWVWICTFCGTAMERQWWTCSLCGKMKESSK
ncbi:zinc ion binding protein [Metarhizium album ARSEF 1941]|uniref:Zinc ion binding protein n=1 Tax=Metarhizium album (strain ARSEF 1941) TaxID=1081103 RepID=A0A0B2WT85_METAS|nr:zinc ion binding protein [Metarhizium album ARSEF 1941]KHN96849.1 zinc ion binding protein [Metarhizium album ARSEF 1941]